MSETGSVRSLRRTPRDPSPVSLHRGGIRETDSLETRPNPVSPESPGVLMSSDSDAVMEDSHNDSNSPNIWIQSPPMYEYISLVDWLKSNFDYYFKLEFEGFLTREFGIVTVVGW